MGMTDLDQQITDLSAIQGSWSLAGYSILRASGPDAVAFMHAQLTNAVQDMGMQQARPGAYCTAQGRLLANGFFWLEPAPVEDTDNKPDVLFLLSADLAPSLLRRLGLFVLRSRVRLQIDQGLQVSGHMGMQHLPAGLLSQPAWSIVREGDKTWVLAPPAPGWHQPAAWCIGPASPPVAGKSGTSDPANLTPMPTDIAGITETAAVAGQSPHINPDALWTARRLAGARPFIAAATQDKFLPAALNMDLDGNIDFKKGCYPGQEVIARSHYRGTVKRRMARGTAILPAGSQGDYSDYADLYPAGLPDSRPVGRLIECVSLGDRLHLAAEISLADWPDMQYAAGSGNGPVLELELCAQDQA